ncbi:GNAT family N-acetyltransferase [Maribacter hydrothermalis]|uniref:GNAT family acetyltransferase n=1 Tax=Maribacter hydrothermalis TaxID=1836467 RepID=A0A1B7Z8R7_9FLAO|nr:GNAT family N-acetyltransferase [Maribacter hydrothermalis]APQ18911.1 GNAT family N-acetyltransferase [Maribacter hydrothermalis]OBR39076.1 GNAT family acetyltransferase [Maribacter hydrothermalis]
MNPKIVQITSQETLPIRHEVMWPTKPLDYVKLPKDDEGLHYGLFVNNELISVISLFINDGEAQFRKFATLKKHQGKGYGSTLLNEIMRIASEESLNRIWCNARQNKSDFYTKFGMIITDETYVKGGIDFVVMERILP